MQKMNPTCMFGQRESTFPKAPAVSAVCRSILSYFKDVSDVTQIVTEVLFAAK